MTRKNIVFIMADQLTADLIGCYGDKKVKTPHIDRLSARGITFDTAYTPCPLCAPARAAMFSGRYVSRFGAYDNGTNFPCDVPTFMHHLNIAGYNTVASGKTHFIGADQMHGFARRLTTDIYPSSFIWAFDNRGQSYPEDKHRSGPWFPRRYKTVDGKGDMGPRASSWGLRYDEETTFRALEFIGQEGEKIATDEPREPFFLHVSYHHPHDPFYVPLDIWDIYKEMEVDTPEYPEDIEKVYSLMDRWINVRHNVDREDFTSDRESLKDLRRAYYGLVTYIDNQVGKILTSLEDNNLLHDTIIIFSSDHGEMLGDRKMIQKRSFREWAARVPLIVSFPDRRHAGVRVKSCASLVDIAPTILDFAGVAYSPERFDGRSLTPLYESGEEERECFSEYHVEGVFAPCFMLRRGRHKYIYVHGYDDDQLYDMESDPREWNNLIDAPAHQELAASMKRRFFEVFDPDRIKEDIENKLEDTILIRESFEKTGESWDAAPAFDPSRQYVRDNSDRRFYIREKGTKFR